MGKSARRTEDTRRAHYFLRLAAHFLPHMPTLMVKLPNNWENQ